MRRPHLFQATHLYDSFVEMPEEERRRFAVPDDGGPVLTPEMARLV